MTDQHSIRTDFLWAGCGERNARCLSAGDRDAVGEETKVERMGAGPSDEWLGYGERKGTVRVLHTYDWLLVSQGQLRYYCCCRQDLGALCGMVIYVVQQQEALRTLYYKQYGVHNLSPGERQVTAQRTR